jgi:hypothetical protein
MDKYIDNKLAEEMDLIILTTNGHTGEGLPKGTIGTLIQSYTCHEKPLYGLFNKGEKSMEAPLGLRDFRVLNPKNGCDATLIATYLYARHAM